MPQNLQRQDGGQAFAGANELAAVGPHPYGTLVITPDGGQVRSSSGIAVAADASLATCPPLHTLLIAGGAGARRPEFPDRVIEWADRSLRGSAAPGCVLEALR